MRFALFAAVSLALASCDSVAPPDGFEGTWDWTYTDLGIGAGPTPEAFGYNLALSLSDSEFVLFRNGERVQEGRYDLSRNRTFETEMLRFQPLLDDPAFDTFEVERLLISVDRDRLNLSAPCFDCVFFSFRRAE